MGPMSDYGLRASKDHIYKTHKLQATVVTRMNMSINTEGV